MDKRNRRGALAYLIIAALTVAAFAATMDGRTLEAMARLGPLDVLPLVLAWGAGILLDSGALALFLRAGGNRIRFRAAAWSTFVRLFFNVVTPSSFGGQPFAVAALAKSGVPFGPASTAVLTKTAVYSVANFSSAFAASALFPSFLRSSPAIGPIFLATGILGLCGIGLFMAAMFVPALLIPAVKACVRAFARLSRVFRRDVDAVALSLKTLAECGRARRSFVSYFRRHPLTATLACLLTFLIHLANLALLSRAIALAGGAVPLSESLALGAILFFLISFLPSPGAAGLGEAVYAALFARRIPLHLLGLSILSWRMFNQYLNALIGALVSARVFSEPHPRPAPRLAGKEAIRARPPVPSS